MKKEEKAAKTAESKGKKTAEAGTKAGEKAEESKKAGESPKAEESRKVEAERKAQEAMKAMVRAPRKDLLLVEKKESALVKTESAAPEREQNSKK